MVSAYSPILLLVLLALGLAGVIFVLALRLGPKAMTPEKAIPYESGSDTAGARHLKLSVKFYLTAILFVVFDIEAVFLYPWAPIFRRLGVWGLVEMALFLGVLGLTLFYAWKKGALEWVK